MPFISGGIFTIGCSCANSITYGFEVHVGGESSRIPYKFLMNRRIDWQNLEGFIYDNSCNLHRYSLNHDPKKFEKFHFLVDGCHFQGQKKLKKRDERTGSDGHLGCSDSYNFMEYKKYTSVHKDGAKNSQGREQMHAILKPLAKSLRQMNYYNFFRTLIVFFSVRNLIVMDKI